jgi:hypothetical protein
MILKRHKIYDRLAEFDPSTGKLDEFSRSADSRRAEGAIMGFYDTLGGTRALLFRLAGVLYLQIGAERVSLADHAIELHNVSPRRLLRVLSRGVKVIEAAYDAPETDPPLSEDPTPCVEEEHFDFGLFLANLSRNRSRQARLFVTS